MNNELFYCGAGGFIAGHLVKRLNLEGHNVICAYVKPLDLWFQLSDDNIYYGLLI